SGVVIEEHAYDAGGRGLTSSLADGREKYTLGYGSSTSDVTVTDALGNVTTYSWSGFGGIHRRVTKIVGPCASCGGGQQTQTFTYDVAGRLLSETDGLGHTTSYTYNDNGDRLSQTDPLGHVTTYTYDDQGRVLTATSADGGQTSYTYVPAGPHTIT